MQPTYFIPIIIIIITLSLLKSNQRLIIAKKVIKKRESEGNTEMIELAKKFIEKECLLYRFDGDRQYQGTIKEVSSNAVLIEANGQLEAINLDFIVRIREYPTNKKGKKKSVVLD